MTDRELLEIIATQVAKLIKDVDEIKTTMASMATKQELEEVKANMATKQELAEVKAIVMRIENDHGQKLGALFNGYKMNSERLDRVEARLDKHERILFRESSEEAPPF